MRTDCILYGLQYNLQYLDCIFSVKGGRVKSKKQERVIWFSFCLEVLPKRNFPGLCIIVINVFFKMISFSLLPWGRVELYFLGPGGWLG